MNQNQHLIRKYFLYFKERFPVAGALLYAGSLFFLSYLSASLFGNPSPIYPIQALFGLLIIFLTLLHLRIFDEHKDYEKDKLAHPDRMLSKGLIQLSDLKKLLYWVLFFEAWMSLSLGIVSLWLWMIILIWSYLMYVEFFMPDYLNKHMGLYLISHQLIVPVIFIFGLIQRINPQNFIANDSILLLMLCISTMCSTMTYEISRKTWSKDKEHEFADSYTKSWGIPKTIIINQIVALMSCIIFLYVFYIANLSITFSIITLLLFLVLLSSEIYFMLSPDNKKSKIVEASGILFLIGGFINAGVGFYSI